MLVSVGITVCRRPAMLLQSAGSILGQTHQDIDLMIGINPDDAEAESLIECADALLEMDTRVRIVWCPNCKNGFEKNRVLIAAARGDWMAGIDYDDLWMPDRLEKQIPYAGKYDIVSAMAMYFGDKFGLQLTIPSGELKPVHFAQQNPVASPTTLMRKSDATKIDSRYAEGPYDYKLWVDLVNAGRKFYALPEVLALHRLSSDSYYNTKMDQGVVDSIRRTVRT